MSDPTSFWRSLLRPEASYHLVAVPTINDQPADFDRLFQLLAPVEMKVLSQPKLRVEVDFSQCQFLQQNGVILLGGMARAVESRGGYVRFRWDTLAPKVRLNLHKNGFLAAFGLAGRPVPKDKDNNTIAYREHGIPQKNEVIEYLRKDWLDRGWISVSKQLRDALVGSLWEIYANAGEHASSRIGVISCGQYYPRLRRVKLTIVDFGIGIPENVGQYFGRPVRAYKALQWAFTAGTSTKPDLGRGLGLSIVKELVKVNKGGLGVFSNRGHLAIDEKGEVYGERAVSFSGTIVTIELRCDKLHYCFVRELGRRRWE